MIAHFKAVCRTCGWTGKAWPLGVDAERDGDQHAVAIARATSSHQPAHEVQVLTVDLPDAGKQAGQPRMPSTATAQREAAREHTHRAYRERNELLRLIAALPGCSAHLMPLGGKLAGKSDSLDRNVTLCLHTPEGMLAYVINNKEAAEDFPGLELAAESHYDRATKAERSRRIAALAARFKAA